MGVSSRILHFFKIIISERWWEGTHRFALLPRVFSKEIEGDLQRVQPVLSTSQSFPQPRFLGFRNPWDVWLAAAPVCYLSAQNGVLGNSPRMCWRPCSGFWNSFQDVKASVPALDTPERKLLQPL